MIAETNPPPAYPTPTHMPPSSETATAPNYTPLYTLTERAETQASPHQASRNLPPSRPLECSDRLGHTNQSTTINIGRPSERDEEAANTSTSPASPRDPDAGAKAAGAFCCLFFLLIVITMISSAVFLKDDAAALKENSRVLDRMFESKKTVTETVTRWDSRLVGTVTVTAGADKDAGTATEEYMQRITKMVTQTVGDSLPTGNA
jgi:hypothetical protein